MTDDAKKDCPLACGYEALRKTKFWWAYKGKDLAFTVWTICSLPLLAVLVWGVRSGRLDLDGIWNAPVIALFIIGILGALVDLAIICMAAETHYRRISKKMSFLQKIPFDEAIKLIFVAGSPVYAVWFGAALHNGELAGYGSTMLLIEYLIGLIAVVGCIYDANWLIGNDVKNQDKNAIGCAKRALIRIIGHTYIAAGKCDLVKRSTR